MHLRCPICRRRTITPLAWLRRKRTCEDSERCTLIRITDDAGPPEPEPGETPPPDAWDCICRGAKVILVRVDWETGAEEYRTCPRCRGVGHLGAPSHEGVDA